MGEFNHGERRENTEGTERGLGEGHRDALRAFWEYLTTLESFGRAQRDHRDALRAFGITREGLVI